MHTVIVIQLGGWIIFLGQTECDRDESIADNALKNAVPARAVLLESLETLVFLHKPFFSVCFSHTLIDNIPVSALALPPGHQCLDVVLHDIDQGCIVVNIVDPTR